MPRPAYPSTTLSARVRERLGLTRQELGDFLGVGERQVGHVEARRREYSARALARLRRLDDLVPRVPAPGTDAPAAPAPPSPAEQTKLRARLRDCRHQAQQLTYQQDAWPEQDAALARRRRGLTALGAALAADAAPTDPDANPEREREWLEILLLGTARLARPRPTPTARALVALRLRLLAEEAAALEALLAGGTPG